ncbi:MAG TPA: choice-of-anchor Q domain-containing protein, partial [Bellilinea sp.]|nr:choice-of-anchor Q domain-containing protein [Bellilinea sp.]
YGNVDVDMRYLVIQNGAMDSVNGQTSGAGILNESSLDLLGVVIRNNQVTCSNGIDCINQVGGGIKNFGILDLNNVTIQNNNAIRGGGLFNTGTNGVASIYNTTISGNLAQQSGGGVVNYATIGMVNSTISGNIGLDGVGGIHNDGIFYLGNVTIADNGTEGTINFVNVETALFRNTLITSTLGKTNCNLTHPITSDGYNLSSDNTCGFGAGTGDKINTNPRISLLGNWGGLYPAQVSLTHGLIAGSPVIDAGNINGCKGFNNDNLLTYDQRGQPRFPGRCDIGAFEGSLTQVFLPLVRR